MRGDPRGWRARHHREHVEGDYRNPPPPGEYDELHERSCRLMKRDPVFLDPTHRRIACAAMGETLTYHGAELIDLSVGKTHFHLLARFVALGTDVARPGVEIPGLPPDRECDAHDLHKRIARHYVGIAKKRSARLLTDCGRLPRGGVWGIRSAICMVHNRSHQLQVVRYIQSHAQDGAALWSGARRGEPAGHEARHP